MSDAFLRAIAFVLPHEEEFKPGHWGDENYVVWENVSGDSGGVTKYGIDASSHPGVDIKNLDRDGAVAIYYQEWQAHHLDAFPALLAIAMFDVWVNGGHAVAWLQSALNHVCGTNLQVDGDAGDETMAASSNLSDGQIHDVVVYFMGQRDARFDYLAQRYPQDAKFLNGWKQRDSDLLKYELAG